jgi:predicted neutral ceramidase superfamily lipid hydrolase
MKAIKSEKIFSVFVMILLLCCCKNNNYIAVGFFGGFEKDTVLVYYDNKVVFDSVLTTNYSTVKAGFLYFEDYYNKILKVNINSYLSDSILVTKQFHKISVRVKNDSIVFKPLQRRPRY